MGRAASPAEPTRLRPSPHRHGPPSPHDQLALPAVAAARARPKAETGKTLSRPGLSRDSLQRAFLARRP